MAHVPFDARPDVIEARKRDKRKRAIKDFALVVVCLAPIIYWVLPNGNDAENDGEEQVTDRSEASASESLSPLEQEEADRMERRIRLGSPDKIAFVYRLCAEQAAIRLPGTHCPGADAGHSAGFLSKDERIVVSGDCWWGNRYIEMKCEGRPYSTDVDIVGWEIHN